jgi:hypothetical protein
MLGPSDASAPNPGTFGFLSLVFAVFTFFVIPSSSFVQSEAPLLSQALR